MKHELLFTWILIVACMLACGAFLIPSMSDALNVLACATSLLLFVVIVASAGQEDGSKESEHGL